MVRISLDLSIHGRESIPHFRRGIILEEDFGCKVRGGAVSHHRLLLGIEQCITLYGGGT